MVMLPKIIMNRIPVISRLAIRNHKLNRQSFANEDLKEKIHQDYMKARQRILTIPNLLTFSRIAATPAVGYFICNGMQKEALICFTFAATTDLLDGLIARTFNQGSDFGAIMDPIADKLMLTTCLVCLYNAGVMPLWIVKALVMRDLMILIGGCVIRYNTFENKPTLKKYLDLKNYPTIGLEPTLMSKIHTALLCGLIVTHLSTQHMVGLPVRDSCIGIYHIVTATTSVFSLAQYMIRLGSSVMLATVPKSKGV